MIPTSIFKDAGLALRLGTQININHEGCSAGRDTKQRLYIKKVVGGILAYCHHCSDWGKYTDKNGEGVYLRKWLQGKEKDRPIISTGNLPKTFPIRNIHLAAWLRSRGIADLGNFFKSTEEEHLVLPIYSPEGTLVGIQTRDVIHNVGPKYLTRYSCSDQEASWFIDDSKVLFITEDICSAYRINKDTGASAVALLKTTMSKLTESQILKFNPEKLYIWLDPDSAGKHGAKKIYKRFLFLPSIHHVALCSQPQEPKECTAERLRFIVEYWTEHV